jgi:hypothetical protein
MKRILVTTLVLLALTLGAVSVLAEDSTERSYEGTLVTSGCFLKGRKSEPAHKECAITCTKRGIPTGLLTAEGEFFPLMLPTEHVNDYMEEKVRVTGEIRKGMIFVTKFEVKEDASWREIENVIF